MRIWKVLIAVGVLAMSGACTQTPTRPGDSEARHEPAEVNTQLGIEYMRKGMYDTALEKFKKAIKQNPRLAKAHSSIAVLYERLGEDELAERHYHKAHKLSPDDPVTLNNFGQFLCSAGRLEEADEMFRRAAADPLYRNPAMIYTNAGICAAKHPDQELAEKYFRSALEKDPAYPPALRQMVRISFGQENYLATRAYLQRLQEVAPLTPEFLWIGVQAESVLGGKDALASYALVLKNRYPESEQAQALIEWERNRRGR
jgi:type IV pilus assembly protein PilF